ncbi:MAG TPA: prephenate dehydrogenase/arogenate dehydrogenase family protein, partial [bacterium]|nr:prephenate dehydrogenase/arogenate dehydrogenase family protein [bacterium]
IGGSVASGARARGLFGRVVGVESDPDARMQARERRLADVVAEDLAGAGSKVDVVVVAVPASATAAAALAALEAFPRAVVTDVAGVKAPVVSRVVGAAGAAAGRFVGGHPMAGTAGKGPASADGELFEDRRVILTPVESTDPKALSVVEGLWRGLGATPVRETPEAHDRAVAAVSHLPHALAFALEIAATMTLTPKADVVRGAEAVARAAGPSFESATRVAASDVETWVELLGANAALDLEALAAVTVTLDEIARALGRIAAGEDAGRNDLREILRRAQAYRAARAPGAS